MKRTIGNLTAALLSVLLVGPALASDDIPETTPEGMKLVTHDKSRIVWAMPGATLEPYTKVALIDCFVAFEKNWERDYNRSASLGRRIRPEDMDRIRNDLAAEFKRVFTKVLTEKGHEVVDQAGPDVLVLRPAIIDLDVTAPDVPPAGITRVVVQSAGAMTLFLELYDSETNAIIARILDGQSDDMGFAREANRVTNKAEADRILRQWAEELADHLGGTRDEMKNGAS